MKGKISLDWAYYLGTIVTMSIGIWVLYLGEVVHSRSDLVNVGWWVILLSVVAFFGRNLYYMTEGSDPNNMVTVKLNKS